MVPLKLMCVTAHPDDESLGLGGTLARYAAEGVETCVVTATRGQLGWQGVPADNPGPLALGRLREAELRAAADALGVSRLEILDYYDGALDQADPQGVIAQLVGCLREFRPHVVVTFGPDGAYGHPDHIAISQFITAACVVAASADDRMTGSLPPHQVSKLYYWAIPTDQIDAYREAFGELHMQIDGVERGDVAWPDWTITTDVDTSDYWQQVWQAIRHHRSQLPSLDRLDQIPDSLHRRMWGRQAFYRAFSLVNGGRAVERDLFEGLR